MLEDEQCELLDKANRLAEKGKTKDAHRIYLRLAKRGFVHAQLNLGTLLSDQIKPARLAEAVYWYKRAARTGYAPAAWSMAMHYRTFKKPRWQLHWLKVAARLGDKDAQSEIRKLERTLRRG